MIYLLHSLMRSKFKNKWKILILEEFLFIILHSLICNLECFKKGKLTIKTYIFIKDSGKIIVKVYRVVSLQVQHLSFLTITLTTKNEFNLWYRVLAIFSSLIRRRNKIFLDNRLMVKMDYLVWLLITINLTTLKQLCVEFPLTDKMKIVYKFPICNNTLQIQTNPGLILHLIIKNKLKGLAIFFNLLIINNPDLTNNLLFSLTDKYNIIKHFKGSLIFKEFLNKIGKDIIKTQNRILVFNIEQVLLINLHSKMFKIYKEHISNLLIMKNQKHILQHQVEINLLFLMEMSITRIQ